MTTYFCTNCDAELHSDIDLHSVEHAACQNPSGYLCSVSGGDDRDARIAELEVALAQIRQDAEWMAHAWMTLRLGSGLLDTDALNHFDDVANRILNTEQKLNVTL